MAKLEFKEPNHISTNDDARSWITPQPLYVIEFMPKDKLPNRFHRFMMRLLLGWKIEKK